MPPFTTKAPRGLQLIDPVLTTIARSYRPSGFIADRLLPRIPVEDDAGRYPTFPREYWFRLQTNAKVDDRAATPEVDFIWSLDQYFCEDYRLKASVTDKERDSQANRLLQLERRKVELVKGQLALGRELSAAAVLRHTSNGGQLTAAKVTPATKWDTAAATIELDVKAAKREGYILTGRVPNTIVIPYLVACEIAVQPDIREILKYTVDGREILRLGELVLPAVLWGMQVVVPMGALRDPGREGAAPADLEEIWGDHVRCLYVDRAADWGVPSVGYTFSSRPDFVDRWHENDPPVDYVRAWENHDQRVCAPELGVEIEDVL